MDSLIERLTQIFANANSTGEGTMTVRTKTLQDSLETIASLRSELAALRARIADGELADIADDGKHNGESALLSAAIRAGYYRGLPVLVLPATVLETPTARDGGSE
jgi:hypothetical protein